MAGKWDKEIIKLFKDGLGAREIAKILGIKHHATVSKRLIKLDLKRPKGTNQSDVSDVSHGVQFLMSEKNLNKAAEDYLKFLCRICGHKFLIPSEDEPFDLMVDFGEGYKKVQVKSSYLMPNNNCCFKLDRTRHNSTGTKKIKYDSSDVDYFFLMDIDCNCWLIPFKEVGDQCQITPERRYPNCKIQIVKLDGRVAEQADARDLDN